MSRAAATLALLAGLGGLVPLAVAAPLRFDAGIEWGSPEMVVYLALGGVLLSTAVCGLFIAART